MKRRVVIGTAGHIDHGKSRLVQALTGCEPDRLPEEKRRGISIELGFAPLRMGEDVVAGIVDVPGHEKFVSKMVGGAAGIDLLLLVVAANEGVKPQTVEHLEICRLLRVDHAICALTKIDLASPEQVEKEKVNLRSILAEPFPTPVEIIPVSSETGEGIEKLRKSLQTKIENLPPPIERSVSAIPVDRVFSLTGLGTVVTGTLSGSSVAKGDTLVALPEPWNVTVRSLQIFGEDTERAEPKTRLAINLSGPQREDLYRGQTLCKPDEMEPTSRVHAKLEWLTQPPKGTLRVLCGTQDLPARVIGLDDPKRPTLAELRLLAPAVFRQGDRFIVRAASPTRTLAGGTILDPHPRLPLRKSSITKFDGSTPAQRLQIWIQESPVSLSLAELALRSSLPTESVETLVNDLVGEKANEVVRFGIGKVVSRARITTLQEAALQVAQQKDDLLLAHVLSERPFSVDKELAETVIGDLAQEGKILLEKGRVRWPRQEKKPKAERGEIPKPVRLIEEGKMAPPSVDDLVRTLGQPLLDIKKTLARQVEQKTLIRVSDQLYYSPRSIFEAQNKLASLMNSHSTITISDWKETIGLTRKYAIPLLEYFDQQRITLRRPDRTRIAGPGLKKN